MQNHPMPALVVVCKETFNLEYVSKVVKVDHLFTQVLFNLSTSDGCFAIFKFGEADFQRHSTIFVDFVPSV